MSTRIQIDIVGPRPNEVDIDDLAKILEDLRKAVSACLPDGRTEGEAALQGRVSLVDVVDGSDGLVFEVQPNAARAVATLSGALRRRSFSELPIAAHQALYRINQYTGKRSWGVRFRRSEAAGIEQVEVVAPDHVTPPQERKTISGGTSVLARCLRVGGATRPRAELRMANNRLLHVEVSEVVARELGKRLYDEVVLSGVAKWDATDGDLVALSVTGVSPFHSVPISTAFKELASAARGRLDNLDAESFVRSIRQASE